MGLLDPTPPPYDPLAWRGLPFRERARMVCEAWAMQGYGTPLAVYAVYAVKIALYVLGWALLCGTSPSLGPLSSIASWWLAPLAFQKAIVWSMLFEALGLGCGSGPLTGRYFPPIGGFLSFLRPGTTKLPLFPGAPIVGGVTRSWLDVSLYAAFVALSVRALVAQDPSTSHWLPLAVIVPVLGLLDKTLFLAARAEHFWVTLVCFTVTRDFVPAAMTVQLALWFWAGFSKLNHHFPTVACVMNSNAPLSRIPALRRAMYRDFPRDLRPSRLAAWIAHGGTLLEFAVPIAFVLTPRGAPPIVAIALMLALHGYITSNVPMGVPLEWNVIVVYAGFALFFAHPDVSPAAMFSSPGLAAFVIAMSVGLPLVGNFAPSRVSFLLSMRYYAGNWAYSVWLFRGASHEKLRRLTTSSAWVFDQLARFYDHPTAVGLFGKVMAFRLMHLHGRALPLLLPKAVPSLDDHEWVDGEVMAGMVLGWNFGEGHLHQHQLLDAVQRQCGFEPGELRCIFVESQPMLGRGLAYEVVDASTGTIDEGEVAIADLRALQPWGAPDR